MSLVIGILAVLLLTPLGTIDATAQISPGTLSNAHGHLSGSGHCIDCHDFTSYPPVFKCLECHREIRQRLQEKRGLHPSLVGGESGSKACTRCHSDHNGKDAKLIRWDAPVNKFDHHRAGYTLEGRHARLACKECHQPKNIPASAANTIAIKDLNRTYLGLSPGCDNCHVDEHRGQLPADCLRCHDFTAWKNARQFNHARAKFTLTDAHEKVACEKCHARSQGPKPYTKFTGLAYQDCAPCHQDPHRGAFRTACANCHAPVDWKPAQLNTTFSHGSTHFPLDGKHAGLACGACHQKADFKQPVAHDRCTDCHKKDVHQGQFRSGTEVRDCGICHTVQGFKPSTYDAERHRQTRFSLAERHAVASCSKCHVPKGEATVYSIPDTRCVACHDDIHQGQFAGAPYANRCESCHNLKSFKPASYSLMKHRDTHFPLIGAHGAVICADCHRRRPEAGFSAPLQFRFAGFNCKICHEDPHLGQFANRITVQSDGTVRECDVCHTPRRWRELVGFDHGQALFPLEGAHRAAACAECHKPVNLQSGMKGVIFKAAPHDCAACHADIHGGQFVGESGSVDCSRCHKILKWKPSTFDHERGSSYSLQGAHKEVPCQLCHTNKREVSGQEVLVYKPTPRECTKCHANDVSRGPGRDISENGKKR